MIFPNFFPLLSVCLKFSPFHFQNLLPSLLYSSLFPSCLISIPPRSLFLVCFAVVVVVQEVMHRCDTRKRRDPEGTKHKFKLWAKDHKTGAHTHSFFTCIDSVSKYICAFLAQLPRLFQHAKILSLGKVVFCNNKIKWTSMEEFRH